ncbi:hypothetical protein QYE76_000017 [Lolium multiflorum]|uniref:Uncharacterized protein n=1 Tax=Lolium multiflorum TaxID=4521 RepID=A0AAD8VED5_LOLMU|nr:hypothetical protein QYE76_000017 [Lolium multiflorum]
MAPTPPTPPPPPPPPPGFFEWRDAMAAAAAKTSTSAKPPPTTTTAISFTDTIADISPYIPITLDLAAHNYYHWRHLFDVHLGRCNLRSHVAADAHPQPHDSQWVKDDLAIVQWIYMHVSTEIFNLVHRDGASAADLWTALRQLFQDNVDARANILHTELRNTVQGDSPVGVYCQRLKAIADELRELCDPIDDRQLINVLLVGLSERFEKQTSFIPMMRPRPSFAEVRSMLQWADRAQTTKDSRPQLFTAAPRPPAPPPTQPPPPMAPPQPSSWRPSPNYRGRNPKPPQLRTAPTPPPPSAPPPAPPTAPTPPLGWRPSPDPWTGLVQAWPMPWSAPTPYGAPPAYTGSWQPGARPHAGAPVLAPRQPTAAFHAAPAYNAPPYAPYGATSVPYMLQPNMSQYNDGGSVYTPMPALLPTPPYPPAPMSTPASTSTPSWDQAAFIQAMNNFAAQGNSGLPDQDRDRSIQ